MAVRPAHAPPQGEGIGPPLIGNFPLGGQVGENLTTHGSPTHETLVGQTSGQRANISRTGAKALPRSAVGSFLVWGYYDQGFYRQTLVHRWKLETRQLGRLGKGAGHCGGPLGHTVQGAGLGGMALGGRQGGQSRHVGAAGPSHFEREAGIELEY